MGEVGHCWFHEVSGRVIQGCARPDCNGYSDSDSAITATEDLYAQHDVGPGTFGWDTARSRRVAERRDTRRGQFGVVEMEDGGVECL